MLHTKFQTPRTILSGSSRVSGGWCWWVVVVGGGGGGGGSDNRVKPNQVKVRLWLSCG